MAKKSKRELPLASTAPPGFAWRQWVERRSAWFVAALILIASARIVATYSVFSHTSDEPAHIACGMEWLEKGAYRFETQHPPLARVAVALGPYLTGVRGQGDRNMIVEGAKELFLAGQYDRTLALARLGVLPFFWVAAIVVYFWARKDFGPLHAVIAVFFFTLLPPVLAHAGLATTDMALTAFVGASFLSGIACLEKPSLRSGLVFGVCTALAVVSKFSSLPFLAVAFAAAGLVWIVQKRGVPGGALTGKAKPLCAAIACIVLIVWAMYRFSFGHSAFLGMRVPAPELFDGIQQVINHNRVGHPAYLLGMLSLHGWWYYYPVVLAVKTPLPFLALTAIGAVICWKATRRGGFIFALPLAFSLSILAFAMSGHINIGVRHILPVYVGFSIVAAVAAVRLFEMGATDAKAKWGVVALAAWMAGTSLAAHPDYLAYFNAFAGGEPERVLVDSDLDWGQDLKRLATRLQEAGAREVAFTPFTIANFRSQGFPPVTPGNPQYPSPGWNAVSLTYWKTTRLGLEYAHPEAQLWPDRIKPDERVGKGIFLWYFPPGRTR